MTYPFLLNITPAVGGVSFDILFYAEDYQGACDMANDEWPLCEIRNRTRE